MYMHQQNKTTIYHKNRDNPKAHKHTHTNRERQKESIVFDYFFIIDKTNKEK